MTHDHMPYASGVAYDAVKVGKLAKTWVFDSKIFVVKRRDDRPHRVVCYKDIPS